MAVSSSHLAHKAARRELILGTGGAFLVHVVAAATLLLLPFLQPPRHTQEPFINVYFADMEGSRCSLSGTGPADGADGGKQPEQSPPEVKPSEKEAAPDVPKVKTMGQDHFAREKPEKDPLRAPRQGMPRMSKVP